MRHRLLAFLWYEDHITFAFLMTLALLLLCLLMGAFFNARWSLYQQRAFDLAMLKNDLQFKQSIVANYSPQPALLRQMSVRENVWYQLDSQAQLLEFLKDMAGRNIAMKNITIQKHKFYWLVFFL